MSTKAPALVVVGGFPGTGKSMIARRLARQLVCPWLCSDTIGAPIRARFRDKVPPGEAYGAGYDVLYALASEFLADGCSVVADMSMGWESQWERLDEIAKLAGVQFIPVILRCPYQTCVERIEHRHRDHPDRYPPAERFLRQPQLTRVWELLDTLDRPDILIVDADRGHEEVYADTWRHLSARLDS
jgi:predicted kinase